MIDSNASNTILKSAASRIIKIFSDKSVVAYDWGSFDEWCVYLSRPSYRLGLRYAPKDVEYFTRLLQLSEYYGAKKIYEDFVVIYSRTAKTIDDQVLSSIYQISQSYYAKALTIEIIFTIMYAGMVAEENKQYAKLGKRIKRLGLHQVLIDGFSPQVASEYSKGKNWRMLDDECKKRFF